METIKKNISIYGVDIRENNELTALSLSDLITAYNYARVENKWGRKNITSIMGTAKFIAFVEEEFKIVLDKKNISKSLKSSNLIKTIGARETRNVFVNEKIWNYIHAEFFIRNTNKDKREYRHFDKYADLISNVFKGVLPFEFEKKVLKYRVDVYFDSLNLCVEYDEKHHNQLANNGDDNKRQLQIEKELSCKFIRVKIGDEIDSINQILKIYKAENIITTTDAIFGKK